MVYPKFAFPKVTNSDVYKTTLNSLVKGCVKTLLKQQLKITSRFIRFFVKLCTKNKNLYNYIYIKEDRYLLQSTGICSIEHCLQRGFVSFKCTKQVLYQSRPLIQLNPPSHTYLSLLSFLCGALVYATINIASLVCAIMPKDTSLVGQSRLEEVDFQDFRSVLTLMINFL